MATFDGTFVRLPSTKLCLGHLCFAALTRTCPELRTERVFPIRIVQPAIRISIRIVVHGLGTGPKKEQRRRVCCAISDEGTLMGRLSHSSRLASLILSSLASAACPTVKLALTRGTAGCLLDVLIRFTTTADFLWQGQMPMLVLLRISGFSSWMRAAVVDTEHFWAHSDYRIAYIWRVRCSGSR